MHHAVAFTEKSVNLDFDLYHFQSSLDLFVIFCFPKCFLMPKSSNQLYLNSTREEENLVPGGISIFAIGEALQNKKISFLQVVLIIIKNRSDEAIS